jgi:hypothetical protein
VELKRIFPKGSRCPGQDSKAGPPIYEAKVLASRRLRAILRPQCEWAAAYMPVLGALQNEREALGDREGISTTGSVKGWGGGNTSLCTPGS